MEMKKALPSRQNFSARKRDAELASIDDSIGALIREKRRELGMSLKELSAATGLSIGLLSQVERGLSSPSVRALNLISAALDVPTFWFFSESSLPQRPDIVLRKSQRRLITYAEGITKQILTHMGMPGLELMLVEMSAHASSGEDFYSHPGEEAGYVLSGSLRLFVEDDVFLLREGDTFKFASTTPHRFENPDAKGAQVLWVLTAPSYV